MGEFEEFAEALFGQLSVEINEEKEIAELAIKAKEDLSGKVNFKQIEETLTYEFSYNFTPSYVTRKDQLLPVILSCSEGKIEQARWGTRKNIKHSKIYPWVRAEGIIKNIHTRILIPTNPLL